VKVDWVDDWPVFNEGRNITRATATRSPVEQAITHIGPGDIKWQADLSRQDLELGWYLKSEFAIDHTLWTSFYAKKR
jgi:hypothetical protein